MKTAVILLLLLLSPIFANRLPQRPDRVNDLAKLLTRGEREQMSRYLEEVEKKTGVQIVVLTVQTTGSESIEGFSVDAAQRWGVGRKGEDSGILFVVARRDRTLRIEVGYGLEHIITDAQASTIIRSIILPHFRAGEFNRGIMAGVQTLGQAVTGDIELSSIDRPTQSSKPTTAGDIIGFLLLILILFLRLRFGGGVYRGGLRRGGFGGTIGGFSGGRGFSSGGFRGGGGSFGGGGASGRW